MEAIFATGAAGIVAVIAIALCIERSWRRASAVIKATEEGR
jgi:hypothetical protein